MGEPLQLGYDFGTWQISGKKRLSVGNFHPHIEIWAEELVENIDHRCHSIEGFPLFPCDADSANVSIFAHF